MSAYIEIKELSYRYPYQDSVLNDLCFSVSSGDILGVLGRNGSGKTTLMNLLLGIKKPSHGHISIFGKNPFEDKTVFNDKEFT